MIKKIYINPGHSDRDPGAVGYETERELNVKVSNFMNEYLLSNYECETRINPGTMEKLAEIANDANTWGADLFVSNHFNAAGGDGYEAYIYSKNTVQLGKIFAKHVKAAGQNLRSSEVAPGVKIRPTLAVLWRTNMPAILTEGAFVDNKKDIEDWNDDAELKVLGIAYAEAAAEYLNLDKKAAGQNPARPVETQKPASSPETVKTTYRVQVGSFSKKAYANAKLKAVKAAGFKNAFLANVDNKLWRVQIGPYDEKTDAVKMQDKLQKAGFSGYVTTLGGTTAKEDQVVATTPTKSIDELAREVIQGKHGNGEARKKSLGDMYAAVQKRVNELLK